MQFNGTEWDCCRAALDLRAIVVDINCEPVTGTALFFYRNINDIGLGSRDLFHPDPCRIHGYLPSRWTDAPDKIPGILRVFHPDPYPGRGNEDA